MTSNEPKITFPMYRSEEATHAIQITCIVGQKFMTTVVMADTHCLKLTANSRLIPEIYF